MSKDRSCISGRLFKMGKSVNIGIGRGTNCSSMLNNCRVALVPTFSFGENWLFKKTFNNDYGTRLRDLQDYLMRTTRSPIFLMTTYLTGRGIINYDHGLLPFRIPITVVSKFNTSYYVREIS